MDIFDDDIDFVAEYLASFAFALRLALEHPANVCGNDLAGAAFILESLLQDFAQRLSIQSVPDAGADGDDIEDDPDGVENSPEEKTARIRTRPFRL